jgi:hypothetical protein
MERMTLDEFLKRAPASLEAFAASTRRNIEEGEEGFTGPNAEMRTELNWWQEVAAYHEYVEATDRLMQDRRSNVERRNPL